MIYIIRKIVLIIFISAANSAIASDWIVDLQDNNCAIGTLESFKGNLDAPSYFEINILPNSGKVFAFIHNNDWDLKKRKTKIYLEFDNNKKSIPVILSDKLAIMKGADFTNMLRDEFIKSNNVFLLNSKNKKIASFNLIGFSNAYNKFLNCAGVKLATDTPKKLIEKKSTSKIQNIDTKSGFKNIARIAILVLCSNDPAACAAGVARGLSGSESSNNLDNMIDYQDNTYRNKRVSNKYLSNPSRNKKQCNSDFDCKDIRLKCVKRLNESMCVRLVDEDYRKIRDRKAEPDQCRRNRDCPHNFKCDRSLRICISNKQ